MSLPERTKKEIVKENLNQLKEIFKLCLPKGRGEICCFILLFLIYFSCALLFLYTTCIIDKIPYQYDIYLYFDNTIFFHTGCANIVPHPLMPLFIKPFMVIGNILVITIGYKAKGVFFILITSILTTLSVIYINRYLRIIIELKGFILYLITFLFACFSTTIVLSFTTESYTISAFLLTFSVFFYSYQIVNNKRITLGSSTFLATLLGGVTITNFAQGLIPMLFTKESFKQKVKRISLIIFCFTICLIFIELKFHVIELMLSYYTDHAPAPNLYISPQFYRLAFDHFWGAPILFPEPIGDYTLITLGFYNHWWHYAFAIPLALLVLYSITKNIKNVHIQILTLLFAFNIFLHIVLGFGIHEASLYGGHWVYIIPLLLGWLYQSLLGWKRHVLLGIILFLMIIALINNVSWMIDFWHSMVESFPPTEYVAPKNNDIW